MKKLFPAILMLMMMGVVMGFSACSSDDDDEPSSGNEPSSAIVGTWDVVESVEYSKNGDSEVEDTEGDYWVFTQKQCTMYDEGDVFNGVPLDYTYSDGQLTIAGFVIYTVQELTAEKMVLKSMEISGHYCVITFKKR